MKYFTSTLLLSLILLSTASNAELKAAFINSSTILQKAPQAIEAVESMQKEFKDREQKLRDLAESIKTREENWQKDSAIMSADQKKKMENELIEDKRKLRFDAQSLKEDVDLRRKQEMTKLRTSISKVINDYAEKNGYDLIFTEGVAYAADQVNITDEILKELGEK
jgi:outer membrane protein